MRASNRGLGHRRKTLPRSKPIFFHTRGDYRGRGTRTTTRRAAPFVGEIGPSLKSLFSAVKLQHAKATLSVVTFAHLTSNVPPRSSLLTGLEARLLPALCRLPGLLPFGKT
jgi:hypothetical protein